MDVHLMGIESINEPGQGHTTMLTPVSINEPPDGSNLQPPVIDLLSPDSCVIGDPDFTLIVTGTGFSPGSVIHFAGHDEPTKFTDDGWLTTGVKPSLWTNPDVVQVQVKNGPLISNAVDFAFNAEGTREADPDDLEDEIDEAADEGDFKSTHPPRRKKR
jgi:hypothetical protein